MEDRLKLLLRAYLLSEREMKRLHQMDAGPALTEDARILHDIAFVRAKSRHFAAWKAYDTAVEEAANLEVEPA